MVGDWFGGPRRIDVLLVDGHRGAAEALGEALAQATGELLTCWVAVDSIESLRLASQIQPAAVVIDADVGGPGVEALARAFWRWRRHTHPRLVALGRSRDELEELLRSGYFDVVICKPVEIGTLVRVLSG